MFLFLSDFLQKKRIDCFAPIPLKDCRVTKPYLLDRVGITEGTVVLLAIPYYTRSCTHPGRNLSAYAVSKNYHLFFDQLFDELLPQLRNAFPSNRFAGFADHSPIAEVDAAVRAGLGVLGQNGLLLTPKYASYVFLGAIITDANVPCQAGELTTCVGCGACKVNCPTSDGSLCLSALTQKKGALTPDEEERILRHGYAWGCDVCQEVCPYVKRALRSGSIFTPIPFFEESPLPCLTVAALDDMTDAKFAERAYSWRGRDTVRRNLLLLEKSQSKEENTPC